MTFLQWIAVEIRKRGATLQSIVREQNRKICSKFHSVVTVLRHRPEDIVHVAKPRAALIMKCVVSRDPLIMVKSYTAFVRPLLEYCTCTWSPHYKGLTHLIERVQKRFTKRVKGMKAGTRSVIMSVLGT